MTWKRLLNGFLTAAASGGAAACGLLVLDPLRFDYERTCIVFAAGATIGVINWLRRNPWHPVA